MTEDKPRNRTTELPCKIKMVNLTPKDYRQLMDDNRRMKMALIKISELSRNESILMFASHKLLNIVIDLIDETLNLKQTTLNNGDILHY